MKNLKKVFALVLSLAMIVSTFTVSFAAEDTKTDAEICEALGMLKGEGDGVTDEYLAKSTTRFQAALMVLRLQNLEEEALAFEGTETFADAEDVQWVAGRSVLAYLKANPELGWLGDGENFDPNGAITAQAYYKVMLEAIGYKQGTDFEWADVLEFAAEKGLKAAADVENFTNNEIAVVTVETLKAETKEGKKLVDVLVEAGAIDEEKAVEVGLKEAAASEVAVKSAVALNSKVIKVTLKEAAENVSLSQFTIVDKDATQIEIADVELAPWDAENKTVLITLAEDSKSGNLYTVTSGDVSVNFGGKAKDETKPAIDTVSSSDYNEMKITFKEAVRIDGLTVKITKKYADKAELATMDITYADEKTVVVKTADQEASTLYGVVVEGAADLAGNTMDKDDNKSFVGTKKDDSKQVIKEAKALDYNKVYIQFGTNVDFDTISDATFKLEKAYGTATELQVLEARQATTTEAKEFNSANDTTDKQKTAIKKGIVLMVEDMKGSTLYKVTGEGIGTLYGQPMSTTTADKNTTFVGMAKPSGKFKVKGDVKAVSATSIDVTFERKVEKDLAEDIANYEIKKAYGDNAELEVLAAELKKEGNIVRLTVGEMKNSTLYKLTVTNLKDIYGNDQDKMEPTFVGQGKQTKITKVEISRQGDTVIRAKFDKSVGENATDVALYTINNDLGYPESVATVSDDPTCVDLTIPKTTDGKTYELTVKGLNNADGIAMDSEGVKGTFVGRGLAATLPEITGAVTLSKSKIELFFDRDVTDSSVKGANKIWNGSTIVGDAITIKADYTNNNTNLSGLTVYANPQNKNSLVIVSNDLFGPSTSPSYDKLILTGKLGVIKGADASTAKKLTVATSADVSYGPKMVGIVAHDKQHLEVYFDQPVKTPVDTNAFNIAFVAYSDTAMTKDSLSSYKASVSATDQTRVHVYFVSPISEVASGTSVDNQFMLKIANKSVVQGLDLKPAKDDEVVNTAKGYQSMAFAGATSDKAKGIDSGIYGVFTDKRTLEVMFPEPMDKNTIIANKFVVKGINGSSTSTIATGQYVTYSEKDNKATVYFSSDVVLASGQTEMKLDINKTVTNIAGVPVCADKSVSVSSFTNYIAQVAPSSTDAAAPAIANISVDDNRTKLTVEMDKMVVFGSTVDYVGTGLNDILSADKSYTSTDAQAIAKNFNLNALFGDDASVDSALNNYVTSVVRKSDNKTLEFTLNKALKKGSEVRVKVISYVKFNPSDTDTYEIRSINNKEAKTGSDASSSTTGVASSPLYDSQKPQFQGATIDATKKIVTLIFDEDVVSNVADLKAQVKANNTVLSANDTVAISGNKLVITFENGLQGATTITVVQDALKDTSTNNMGTDAVSCVVTGYVPTLTDITVTPVLVTDLNKAVAGTKAADLAAVGTPTTGLTYALDGSGTNDALFQINGTELQIKSGTTLVASQQYTIKVVVTETANASNTFTKDITFTANVGAFIPTLTDINVTPAIVADANKAVAGTKVADLAAVGTPTTGLTYALDGSGTNDALFQINGTELQIKSGTTLVASQQYTIKVVVTEAANALNTFTKEISFNANVQ